MYWKNKFGGEPLWIQFLILLGTSIGLTMAVVFVYTAAALVLTGSDAVLTSIPFLKGTMWIQSIFTFILPSLLIAYWFSPSVSGYLYLNNGPKLKVMLLALLAYILYMPALNMVVQWNEQIGLPDFLSDLESWMKQIEEAARELTENMAATDSLGGLLMSILLIGVVVGVGEELLFRGVIQRLVFSRFKNVHLAVWITAFIFSAIHMQFYGFFPRMLMGAFFGYALVWSGSLYIPILLHAFNNTVVVVAQYLEHKGIVDISAYEEIGTAPGTLVYFIICTLLAVVVTCLVRKVGTRNFQYGRD